MKSMGLSFALRNPQIFEKVQPDGSTLTIPMRAGRSKNPNNEWVETLMANLDLMLAHFEQNVDQVVKQRDSDFFGLLSRYMGVAASGGSPFQPNSQCYNHHKQATPQPTTPPPSGPPKISSTPQKVFQSMSVATKPYKEHVMLMIQMLLLSLRHCCNMRVKLM